MIRGTGEAEKLLKNAKTELWNEWEEIGNYLAIEELAIALNDRDTTKLAKEFRRQEERMASFLQKLIPQLAKQVVREEVPARERKPAAATSASSSRSRSTATRSTNGSSSTSRAKPAASRAKPAASRAKPAASSSSRAAKPAASRAKPSTARASSSRAKKS
jgi:sec-independent protein translocase protein TatB